MPNKTRSRLYTRWRTTLVPGHCTNDRESMTVHKPFNTYMELGKELHESIEEAQKRHEENPEASEGGVDLELLAKVLKARGIRVTKR